MTVEMLGYAFVQHALVAGLLVALLCGLVSFFVVLKRLAFIGSGLAHAAFGGIALGLIAGLNPFMVAGMVATGSAWVIGWLSRKGRLPEDTSIGITFSVIMALGLVLISLYRRYVDIFSYLFGNILTVSASELMVSGLITAIIVAFLGFYFHDLVALVFDEETAEASGLRVGPLYFALLTSLALTVIIAVKLAGTLLTSALIVIPGATAYQLAGDYRLMLLYSVVTSLAAVLSGILISWYVDLPPGATIVLVASFTFLTSLAVNRGTGRIKRNV